MLTRLPSVASFPNKTKIITMINLNTVKYTAVEIIYK
jgi:hypothetical protein